MTDERPCRCPECGVALLIDSPVNILARWPEILARYGFKAVAIGGARDQNHTWRWRSTTAQPVGGVAL